MVESNFIESIKNNPVKFVECNFTEHNSIDTSNLNNQQFRLNKISKIEAYLLQRLKKEN